MYLPLKFENKLRRRALIERGACANAMPGDFSKKLKEESPNSISELQQASFLNVTVASGRTVKVLGQVDLKFEVNDHNFQVAVFQFLSPQEEEKLIEIGPELLALDKMKNGELLNQINQLLRVRNNRSSRQPKRPSPEYDKIWFPTPEKCQNPENLPPLQKKIFDNISQLQQRDSINPQCNENDKETFLKQFDWSKSSLNPDQIAEMQHLLIEYFDILAKHRFDVGYNTELKVKSTPAHG